VCNVALLYAMAQRGGEEIALELIERGADVHIKNQRGYDAVLLGFHQLDASIHFVFLCCGADILSLEGVDNARVNAAISEYRLVQAWIEMHHKLLEHTLSTRVEVDTRFSLGDNGIYQEPLERTLEYLGLSIHPDRLVNASIDGSVPTRVMIPHHPLNAKLWYTRFKAHK
jgi:hypothetical protein